MRDRHLFNRICYPQFGRRSTHRTGSFFTPVVWHSYAGYGRCTLAAAASAAAVCPSLCSLVMLRAAYFSLTTQRCRRIHSEANAAASAARPNAPLSSERGEHLVRECSASRKCCVHTMVFESITSLPQSVVHAKRAAIARHVLRAAVLHGAAASAGRTASRRAHSAVSSPPGKRGAAKDIAASAEEHAAPVKKTSGETAPLRVWKTTARPPAVTSLSCGRLHQQLRWGFRYHTGRHAVEGGSHSSFHHSNTCSSCIVSPIRLYSSRRTDAPREIPAHFSGPPPHLCCGSSSFQQLISTLRSPMFLARQLLHTATAHTRHTDELIHNRTDHVGGHAPPFSVKAAECGCSPERLPKDFKPRSIGVLLLRKASGRECFSKRSMRNVPLVYSNEVQSITFPAGSHGSEEERSASSIASHSGELADSTADSGTSLRDVVDLKISCRAERLTPCQNGSSFDEPARACDSCSSGKSGKEGVIGRSPGMGEKEDDGSHRFVDIGDNDGSLCGGGANGINKGDSSAKTVQRHGRSCAPGLVYVEDDEGTRYGIAYSCPRHPLIAARVLTRDVNEEIGVDFFFRLLHTALRQRRALQEIFDWRGSAESISVTTSKSRRNNGCSNIDCNSSISEGIRAAVDSDNSHLWELCTSNNRHTGIKREAPAGRIWDATAFTCTSEEGFLPSKAAGVVAQANAVARSIQPQAAQQEPPAPMYYRLINGEGDFFPGVAIDLYGEYASIQPLTRGIDFLLPLIVEALHRLLRLRGLVIRLEHPDRQLEYHQQHQQGKCKQHTELLKQQQEHPKQEILQQLSQQQSLRQKRAHEGTNIVEPRDPSAASRDFCVELDYKERTFSTVDARSALGCLRYALGEHFSMPSELPRDLRCLSFGSVPDSVVIEENGCLFAVDLLRGNGTGWLYDRRSAITTMRLGGARECVGVCTNERAFQLALKATLMNGLRCSNDCSSRRERCSNTDRNDKGKNITLVLADVFDWLSEAKAKAPGDAAHLFDVVVLDPPNWAWRSSDLLQQQQKQQELVAHAASLTVDGGYLAVTCSSRHYCAAAAQLLADVQAACAAVGKTAILCGEGSSGPDFPMDVSLPRNKEFCWILLQLEVAGTTRLIIAEKRLHVCNPQQHESLGSASSGGNVRGAAGNSCHIL